MKQKPKKSELLQKSEVYKAALKRGLKKTTNWMKKHKKLSIAGFAVILLLLLTLGSDEETSFYTEDVTVSDVDQIVYLTGTVESDLVVDLQFKQSGTVEEVYVQEGDVVKEGDYLIELDNDELEINVARAKANLDIATAELNLEYAGPESQDISIYLADIREAEVNLSNAMQKLENTRLMNENQVISAELDIENAEIDLESAQNNYANVLESGENDGEISDQAIADAYEDARADVLDALDVVNESLFLADEFLGIDESRTEDDYENVEEETISSTEQVTLNNTYHRASDLHDEAYDAYKSIQFDWEDEAEEVDDILDSTESALLEANSFMTTLYQIAEDADPYGTVTQTDLDSLSVSYAAQKDLITAAINSIQSVQQDITNAQLGLTSSDLSSDSELNTAYSAMLDAENDLEIAQNALTELELANEIEISELEMDILVYEVKLEQEQADYAKLVASPRSVDVAALEAKVEREQADYDQALNELEDSILKAPADGVITRVNFTEGENISALTQDAATLIADKLRITTNISETDITKLEVGNTVDITFDAFPSDRNFEGTVVSIDPAETIVQGVIYYEAKIDFDPEGENVKSGMTANLEVLTGSAVGALAVPPQALNYEDGEIFVFVIEGQEKIRKTVKVGLEGDDLVEILEGLLAGEKVLIYETSR